MNTSNFAVYGMGLICIGSGTFGRAPVFGRSEMTTNQIVAMIFPLLAAAAVILTGLFAKKHWADAKEAEEPVADGRTVKALTERRETVRAA
jgi:hypothetical protein